MNIRYLVRFSALALGLLLTPMTVGAEQEKTIFDSPVPLSLEADSISFDRSRQTYDAQGAVRLQRGGLALTADHFWWNTTSGEAGASGSVRLKEAGGTLEGDALQLNLDTGTARLQNARGLMPQQGFFLSGNEIEKTGERSYRLEEGTFTSCDAATPAWKFGASQLQVDLGGYARARNMLFYLYDVPVFYFPYMLYPVKSERESGFLIPNVGYSSQRGAQLSLAYYQVIARNQDATFALDYFSELGLGKGVEYRYLFGDDNEGVLNGYHVSAFGEGRDSYALKWKHLGLLPGTIRFSADTEYVSSRSFFSDFGQSAEIYNRDVIESVAVLGRNWGKINLGGEFRYLQDLDNSNRQTLQHLPEVHLAVVGQRFRQTPLYYRLDAEAENYWRREGVQGQRYMLRPALAAVGRPLDLFSLGAEAGFRQYLVETSAGGYDESLYDLSAQFSMPVERVYPLALGTASRLRHTISPEIDYLFVPDHGQGDLPVFEPDSVVEPRNRLRYALVNRLTARFVDPQEGTSYLELLRLRLYQEFDLREARGNQTTPTTPAEPFSPLQAELRLAPTSYSRLEVEAGYDFNGGRQGVTEVQVRGSVHGGGNELGLDYIYQRDEVAYFAGRVATDWLKPVYLGYRNRIETETGQALEQVAVVEYRAQCWSILFTYTDRLTDREFLVSFSLAGLGKSTGGGSIRQAQPE
ncbi:MAG: hypothetical protein A2091_13755 [Desulfuromonadales bacterium GWD2_61_12]|nr:MAG: hypothetical protein A2005_05980 [Desulfuromonadales bacterium GWC2_61_20]OGR36490.1 MAG: hypothetical protein A2091_13755 [Desulfuromonadales bacterium GWD2_61_12]HAD04030.1 hypothetical protein [Desulfuromonas sp.]HBT81979.1 hypothetical protein [Desulfuromonas sp.]